MKKLTPEDELLLIDMFLNSNVSIAKIANNFGYKSRDIVYRILDKHNIDKHRYHISNKLNIDDITSICHKYINGASMSSLANEFGVSVSDIQEKLKRNNINIRENRKYHFNQHYFDSIDSHNKAYLLGFIYADGCVNKNNCLNISVHEKDIDILEHYKRELNIHTDIKKILANKTMMAKLDLCSKHMCDNLRLMGCKENKSYSLSFPNIERYFLYDFIRGFMDGDGGISIINTKSGKKYISLYFCGTYDMMSFLKNEFKVDNKLTKHGASYELHIGKQNDVLRILNMIYENAELFMGRKYEKYLEYKKYVENSQLS